MRKVSVKKALSVLLAASMIMTSSGIQGKTAFAAPQAIKSISIKIGAKNVTKKTYKIIKGKSKKLKVSVKPASSRKSVIYKSNNKNIVSVSKKGKLTAKKIGTAKVVVTVKAVKGASKKAWVKIKVVKEKEVPSPTPEIPTAVPEMPTPVPETPAPVTESPTSVPETPAPVTEIPTLTPEVTVSPTPTVSPVPAPAGNIVIDCTINYAVSFESNGGSAVDNQSVAKGKMATKPADPTREGYTFGGWYSDKELTTVYDFTTAVNNKITLYAKWEAANYTVTFDSNNGSVILNQSVPMGTKAARPADPTKEGYTFGGWYSDSGLTQEYDFNTAVTGNLTLYAKWNAAGAQLSLDIEQENSTVTDIHQSLRGTFSLGSSNIDTITCELTNADYEDQEFEGTEVIINESESNWRIEDIRLYPGVNRIKIKAKDMDGNSVSSSVELTYDSGELMEYTAEQVTYTDAEAGTGYINDIILVILDSNSSEEQRETALQNVCESVDGEVVGQLNSVDMYQVQVRRTDYDNLIDYCEQVSELDFVASANCDELHPIDDDEIEPVDESDGIDQSGESVAALLNQHDIIIPQDPWRDVIQGILGQDWDESRPSGLNWWVEAVHAPSAWTHNSSLQDITIGIVDGGIDTNHADLDITNTLINNVPNNHGTHVAGIIGATANNNTGITGLAWNRHIYSYDAYQGRDTSSTIVEGVVQLVESGAKVINDSNGCTLDEQSVDTHREWAAAFVNNLVETVSEDFIIVQAAGNDHIDSRRNGMFCSVTDERALEHIMVVAAADKPNILDGSYKLTSFSNYGDGVTIAAPGRSIFSTIITGGIDGDYGKMSGTSMAAPIVTGIASMVWSVNENFSAADVKDIVVSTATTEVRGYSNSDSRVYRMIDADAAVEEAIARTTADGTAKGRIADATTNIGIGASYRVHRASRDGEVVYEGTSVIEEDQDGSFDFALPAGTYVLEVYGEINEVPFITSYTEFTINPNAETDLGTIAISTEIDENTYRVVLTWGERPYDLDSHFSADALSGGSEHVYYSAMTCPYANLDVDDVTSYGPETITITDFAALDGFTYSVHNYSDRYVGSDSEGELNLAHSDAKVKVYKANSVIAEYVIPTNRAGTVWNVFSIGVDGEITTINTFEFIESPSSVGASFVHRNTMQGFGDEDKD